VKKPMTDPPEKLSELERRRIRIWCEKKYPAYSKRLARMWHECRDWHLKKGEQAVNWEAAMRMWVRKADEFAKKRRGDRERPQEGGFRGGDRWVGVDKIIDDLKTPKQEVPF
jgi:hypothetical protein